MMLMLLLSVAICVLALLMLRHAYVRWRHEYLGRRLPQPDGQDAEPFLGHQVLSKLRSWSIVNGHQALDVTWEPVQRDSGGLAVAGWAMSDLPATAWVVAP
jgi:hypothetical protein